jgi:hypothetical protein
MAQQHGHVGQALFRFENNSPVILGDLFEGRDDFHVVRFFARKPPPWKNLAGQNAKESAKYILTLRLNLN